MLSGVSVERGDDYLFRLFTPSDAVLLPSPLISSNPGPLDEATDRCMTTGLPYPLDTLHASGLWPNYSSGLGVGSSSSSSGAAASSSSSSGAAIISSSSAGAAASSSSGNRDAEKEWLEIIKVYRTVGKIMNIMMRGRGEFPISVQLANPLGTYPLPTIHYPLLPWCVIVDTLLAHFAFILSYI